PLVYHPRPDELRVTLRLEPGVAWVADALPVESRTDLPDGGTEITFGVTGPAFLERLLLRLGPDAEIVGPPAAAAVRREAAARVLERYAPGSTAV
ncbi:MAG: WYL domain-containing protein, partial [Actinomycetes bacterium]